MVAVENPYKRLPIAFDPNKYYGSQEWVHLALDQVTSLSPRPLELTGLPGMGKSTLLRYLAHPKGALDKNREWLQGSFRENPYRLFPLLVEFLLLPTGMHPFLYLYHRFLEEYSKYRARVPDDPKSRLPELREDLAVKSPEDAANALEQSFKTLTQQGVRSMLLLDDFHLAFEPRHLTRDQAVRLRPWRDFVAFILVTERSLHQVNPDAAGSPFYQLISLIRLGPLTENEARTLIEDPAKKAERPFHPKDVEFVLKYADGHPFLLILAGIALWDVRNQLGLLEKQDAPVPKEYLPFLRGRLQEDFSRSFQLYWDRLEPNERDALRALSREAELTDVQKAAVASLEGKGLAKYDLAKKRFELFSPLFADFLARMEEVPRVRPELRLTGLEGNLYEYLRRHPDRICTFEELWREVWNNSVQGTYVEQGGIRRPIQVTVSRLRQKLQELTGEDIISVRGQGYRFVPQVSAVRSHT